MSNINRPSAGQRNAHREHERILAEKNKQNVAEVQQQEKSDSHSKFGSQVFGTRNEPKSIYDIEYQTPTKQEEANSETNNQDRPTLLQDFSIKKAHSAMEKPTLLQDFSTTKAHSAMEKQIYARHCWSSEKWSSEMERPRSTAEKPNWNTYDDADEKWSSNAVGEEWDSAGAENQPIQPPPRTNLPVLTHLAQRLNHLSQPSIDLSHPCTDLEISMNTSLPQRPIDSPRNDYSRLKRDSVVSKPRTDLKTDSNTSGVGKTDSNASIGNTESYNSVRPSRHRLSSNLPLRDYLANPELMGLPTSIKLDESANNFNELIVNTAGNPVPNRTIWQDGNGNLDTTGNPIGGTIAAYCDRNDSSLELLLNLGGFDRKTGSRTPPRRSFAPQAGARTGSWNGSFYRNSDSCYGNSRGKYGDVSGYGQAGHHNGFHMRILSTTTHNHYECNERNRKRNPPYERTNNHYESNQERNANPNQDCEQSSTDSSRRDMMSSSPDDDECENSEVNSADRSQIGEHDTDTRSANRRARRVSLLVSSSCSNDSNQSASISIQSQSCTTKKFQSNHSQSCTNQSRSNQSVNRSVLPKPSIFPKMTIPSSRREHHFNRNKTNYSFINQTRAYQSKVTKEHGMYLGHLHGISIGNCISNGTIGMHPPTSTTGMHPSTTLNVKGIQNGYQQHGNSMCMRQNGNRHQSGNCGNSICVNHNGKSMGMHQSNGMQNGLNGMQNLQTGTAGVKGINSKGINPQIISKGECRDVNLPDVYRPNGKGVQGNGKNSAHNNIRFSPNLSNDNPRLHDVDSKCFQGGQSFERMASTTSFASTTHHLGSQHGSFRHSEGYYRTDSRYGSKYGYSKENLHGGNGYNGVYRNNGCTAYYYRCNNHEEEAVYHRNHDSLMSSTIGSSIIRSPRDGDESVGRGEVASSSAHQSKNDPILVDRTPPSNRNRNHSSTRNTRHNSRNRHSRYGGKSVADGNSALATELKRLSVISPVSMASPVLDGTRVASPIPPSPERQETYVAGDRQFFATPKVAPQNAPYRGWNSRPSDLHKTPPTQAKYSPVVIHMSSYSSGQKYTAVNRSSPFSEYHPSHRISSVMGQNNSRGHNHSQTSTLSQNNLSQNKSLSDMQKSNFKSHTMRNTQTNICLDELIRDELVENPNDKKRSEVRTEAEIRREENVRNNVRNECGIDGPSGTYSQMYNGNAHNHPSHKYYGHSGRNGELNGNFPGKDTRFCKGPMEMQSRNSSAWERPSVGRDNMATAPGRDTTATAPGRDTTATAPGRDTRELEQLSSSSMKFTMKSQWNQERWPCVEQSNYTGDQHPKNWGKDWEKVWNQQKICQNQVFYEQNQNTFSSPPHSYPPCIPQNLHAQNVYFNPFAQPPMHPPMAMHPKVHHLNIQNFTVPCVPSPLQPLCDHMQHHAMPSSHAAELVNHRCTQHAFNAALPSPHDVEVSHPNNMQHATPSPYNSDHAGLQHPGLGHLLPHCSVQDHYPPSAMPEHVVAAAITDRMASPQPPSSYRDQGLSLYRDQDLNSV